MDRKIAYSGEIALVDDFLNAQRYTMTALGMALEAILGSNTIVDGLNCTPNSPADLHVIVGPGSIYSLVNLDGTAYGDLAADTTHQILKQGIVLDNTVLSCPAPGTTGQSINYLIQAAYQDVDTDSTVLPYFNSSNPALAYNGPNNTGVSQNTTRKGQCTLSVKAGTAATTGTQTTPAADAGFTGLWVVTVANGATTIVSGNITKASGAPFINYKLPQLSPANGRTALTSNTTYYVAPGGSDSAAGTVGAPWQTVQHAINVICNTVDLAGFTATIQLADGSYVGWTMTTPLVGGSGSNLIINGNSTTPSNVLVTGSSSNSIITCGGAGTGFTLQNMRISNTGAGGCFQGISASVNYFGVGVDFGVAGLAHVFASEEAVIFFLSNYTISGSAAAHWEASDGNISVTSPVITLTGTPAFSTGFAAIAFLGSLSVNHANTTFSGSATGPRYALTLNAVINTQGGGATYLPGNASGTTDATAAAYA